MEAAGQFTIDRLFRTARSQNGWQDRPIDEVKLREAYDIARWGPTSMNTQPMRVLFLRSSEARERLRPALSPNNVAKVIAAPVVAVIAHDMEFPLTLSRTFPHNPKAASMFVDAPDLLEVTAFRNGSLQAAYLMIALRAVGLDVGPMSGFNAAVVNAEFFGETSWRVNMLCGIGYGDPARVFDRLPRLDFYEATRSI